MKNARQFFIVLVTAPNVKVARRLAKAALEKRLAACANLVPAVESHYWWRGKIERANEILIVFKSVRRHLPALEKLIIERHPYDTPEFLALPIAAGAKGYLDWLATESVF